MTAAVNPAINPRGLVPFLPPKLQAAGQDFGIYGVEFLPLGSLARAQQSFKVEQDHAFLIVAANAFLTTADDVAVTPQEMRALVTMWRLSGPKAAVQPTDPGINDAPLENWFGSGQQWCFWSLPYVMGPSDSLIVTLTNLERTPRNYRLSFIGARCWRSAVMDAYDFCRNGF
jgi:hypothetical protein